MSTELKPHFRMENGRWRLYRDRKELKRGCKIWYDLTGHSIRAMWEEYTEWLATARYYRGQ